jgi:hypothetical protein
VPTDLKRWQQVERAKTRATLLQCLGEMPPRSDPAGVRVLSREDLGDYTLEHFEFHNGVDNGRAGHLADPQTAARP